MVKRGVCLQICCNCVPGEQEIGLKKTGPTGAPGTAIYRYPFQAGIPRWIVRRGSADRFQLDGDYFFSRIDIVARMIQNIHE